MRSPAVVFSLFAVSALSPSIVYGSPVPSGVTHHTGGVDHHRAPSAVAARGLGFLNEVFARGDSTHAAAHPTYTSKPKVMSIAGIDVGCVALPSGLSAFLTNVLYADPNEENFGRGPRKRNTRTRLLASLLS